MSKKYAFYLLTYLLTVDIDIAIVCKHRIDIVSKLKKMMSKQHYSTLSSLISCRLERFQVLKIRDTIPLPYDMQIF